MKDDNFKQLLNGRENIELTDDFDNNMMSLIHKQAKHKSEEKKYLKLMYLFFILGLVFGFLIALTFVDQEFSIRDYEFSLNKIILIIPLVFIILLIFEKLYRATMISKGKEDFSSI